MQMENCKGRPNRSDVHLSLGEESRIEAETRDHFEGLAPKRHSKPQRSDHSSSYLDANTDQSIPEYTEFQRLEAHQEKLVYNSGKAADEFVETDYYKDLNLVDKQHHTTGTGFIKAENTKTGNNYHLEEDEEEGQDSYTACCRGGSCHGNPATNDWIPAESVKEDFASGKPSRSDL